MTKSGMIRNQRVADIANLLAAREGQDRAYDEIDVDLILRAAYLRRIEVAQFQAAVGMPPHPVAYQGPGSELISPVRTAAAGLDRDWAPLWKNKIWIIWIKCSG